MHMTATSTVPPSSITRLPIAHLPSAVLPGATVTLTLATDELRLAITAATSAEHGGRILLTGGDEHELGVVAAVPNVGNLPTGESAAIVRVARLEELEIQTAAPEQRLLALQGSSRISVELWADPGKRHAV